MIKILITRLGLLIFISIGILLLSAESLKSAENKESKKPPVQSVTNKSWWQKRHQRKDIYFPHNAHMAVMQQRGDLCMACHPFTGTPKASLSQQQQLTQLANEPLEAICHECHVVERSAPLDCKVCHNDINKVRPKDHGLILGKSYIQHHATAARQNESNCRRCHIQMSFCTDCHFRHNTTQGKKHHLGYRNQHGLDARLDAASCGRCHNTSYCRDCHRGRRH